MSMASLSSNFILCTSAAPHSPSHPAFASYHSALSALSSQSGAHAHINVDEVPGCVAVAIVHGVVIIAMPFAHFADLSSARTIRGSKLRFRFAYQRTLERCLRKNDSHLLTNVSIYTKRNLRIPRCLLPDRLVLAVNASASSPQLSSTHPTFL